MQKHDALQQAIKIVGNRGQIIAFCRGAGGDHYLSAVAVQTGADAYVVWTVNHEVNGTFGGHYTHDYGKTMELFQELSNRLTQTVKREQSQVN